MKDVGSEVSATSSSVSHASLNFNSDADLLIINVDRTLGMTGVDMEREGELTIHVLVMVASVDSLQQTLVGYQAPICC